MKNGDDEASSGGTFWRMARRRELRDSGITQVPACVYTAVAVVRTR
jgi:phage head maturation protease